MKTQNNPLDDVAIAAPCSARWEEMAGDDRSRFCSHCNLNVYNLSGMMRDEAETLLATTEGRLCIRFYRRADGTVLTQDCPVGLQTIRQRMVHSIRNVAATTVTLLAGIIGFGGSRASAQSDTSRTVVPVRPQMWMGKAAMPLQIFQGDTTAQKDTAVVKQDTVEEEMQILMGEFSMPSENATPTDISDTTMQAIDGIILTIREPDAAANPVEATTPIDASDCCAHDTETPLNSDPDSPDIR